MAIAAVGLGACDDRRPQPLTIDNALTADEIAAGRLTPEVMWKMSRAGSSSLSPDGKTLLYAQTDYNMAQNRGVTTIWVQDMASGAVTRLTDTASNNADPKWSADGRKIYFLSDRSGSMQVWRMNAAGGDATQVTGSGGGEGVPDVEGFGVSPDEKHIWWVQAVQTARRKSSDVYKDMDKSKARIYDDLMARHWDYWDEGSYRHIFIGEMDKARIFVCIVDWTAQQKVFAGTKAPTGTWDPETQTEAANGPIIGYASKFIEETTQGDEMVEVILPINYYQDTAAAPDGKYNIVVSCSTSAYGDYMDACTTNVMYVDDFEWVY